ncbi:MAG TPA: hypothetical protein VHJ17_20715 [Thermomonospora sp.]|nr:hypothetical protein [Thermomonospora sp.]
MLEVKRWSICEACVHLRSTSNPDHQGDSVYTVDIQYCAAFPDGVPEDIYPGGFDHRRREESLWRRRALVRRISGADRLEIPVHEDGSPAFYQVGDARWLGVVTTGRPIPGWEIPKDCARWERTTFAWLAALPPEDLFLYVDDEGPLVPLRDLHGWRR